MARKKETEEIKLEQSEIQTEEVNTDLETTTTDLAPQKEKVVIPQYVDIKLKMYPSYAELFVDNKGGVYTSKDYKSPESILYKNPYHNQ